MATHSSILAGESHGQRKSECIILCVFGCRYWKAAREGIVSFTTFIEIADGNIEMDTCSGK